MRKKTASKAFSYYKNYSKRAFFLLLTLIIFQYSFASLSTTTPGVNENQNNQQNNVTVKGIVKDESGEPLISVSVVVKGTVTGVVTDLDGAYSINVPNANSTLVFSFIGFHTQEIAVNGRTNIDVTLTEDTKILDEVVVVGYGTMRKSDVTGSIATAKGSDIIKGQTFNALDGLKGKAAGVNIFSNTGQPGGEMRVIIRGISTIQASANPLYVVDGVVMDNFQFLNPNDIESIEVLKDASSAAIYGARGANGVILVTTKRGGNTGKRAQISYAGSMSVGTMAKYLDVMDANQWMDAFKQGLENSNAWRGTNYTTDLSQIFTDERLFNPDGSPKYNTDWQKEATRTSFSHNHQLNIQKGDENSSVGAFLNYTDQQGIALNSYMKRLNAKMAYDAKPTKWLSTAVNLMVNHTWGNRTSDNPYGQGALRTMIEQLPWLPVQLDGEYMQTNSFTTSQILIDQNDVNNPNAKKQGFAPEGMGNPVELLKRMVNMQYRTQIFGNAALTFHLAEGLDLKTQFGVDYQNKREKKYEPSTPRPIIGLNAVGKAETNNGNTLYWQEETYLTYTKTLDKSHINAMAGMSWQARDYTYFKGEGFGFGDDFYEYYNIGNGTERPKLESKHEKWTMNSYFMRVAYSYDNKYMVTATGRVDGSSKFGPNNKYGFFPSLGLGWMASNENFLMDNPIISKLKPHASFGVTGNSEIGVYASLPTLSQSKVIIGDKLQVVSYLDKMANPDLKWERTNQWDVGFDLGLFNNRVNVEASYYYKYTTDLLLERPLPKSTGFSNVTTNVGEVSNRGLDLLINAYPIDNGTFNWNTTLNLSFNKNRVEKLDPSSSVDPVSGKRQILKDGFTGYDMLIREGEELSTFYGYKRAGIYDGNPANWDAETMNIPSTIGEKVTYKERQILGNGLPDWMGSFINTFSYKNFDLTLDLQFSWGADIMQEFYHSTEARFLTNGLEGLYTNAWHPTKNPNGTSQAIRLQNFGMGSNGNADDTWVTDGSYLRANLIQLGYTFNPNTLKKIGLSSLRIYGNVSNAFLITASGYKGYDPDNSSRLDDNKWGANRQFFTYPRPRTFTLGLNVAF